MNTQQWGLGMRTRLPSDTLEDRIDDWRSKVQVLRTKSLFQNEEWVRCFFGGRLARRDERTWPKRPVTEEQRRQVPARKQPSGLPIFAAAAALLVRRRSIKDILPPRALQQRQISGNAPAPHFEAGSKAAAGSPFWAGDWRLGMAEERVMLAEARLAAAEMTISSLSPDSPSAARPALIIKGL